MPRKKLKGRKPSKSEKNCECCGRRFDNIKTEWGKKKKPLHGMEDHLVVINSERIRAGKAPLSKDSLVCQECWNFIHSSPTQSSESQTTTSDSESENTDRSSESSSTNSESTKAVPDPPYNPTWPEEHIASSTSPWQSAGAPQFPIWQGVDNATPGPSRLAPTARPPWEERCLLCPLLFEHNVTAVTHVLSSVRLLQVIINGELTTAGHPIAHPGSLVCDPCFNDKLTEYRIMHDTIRPNILQGGVGYSQSSDYSAMDISQSNSQEPFGQSFPQNYDCISSDEFGSVKSDESESSSPPTKKEATKQTMLVDIPSVAVSGHSCFVCGQDGVRKRVGKKCRLGLFRATGIYVHPENRMCPDHLEPTKRRLLNADGLALFIAQVRYEESFFTKEQLAELIKFLEKSLRYSDACKGRMSFKDGHRYTEKDYSIMLGVTKEQFQSLHNIISPFLRNTCARSTEDALAIFLMKLRLNPSVNTLACLFNTTKQRISTVMITVRKLLVKHFVPQWLSYSHITRRDYIDKHTTIMSKTLTGATDEQAISVIDGTYLFHHKSSNYSFQRKSFSVHKFRNLIKIMNIVSSTGYILGAEWPYYGNGANNDANILKSMQKDRDGFRSFFVPGDYIIEDRGFRDSNALMTSLGFSIKMPHFLGKRAQHSTSEANESRLVTKIRWVVEAVNGRIKNVFRFFRDIIPNTYVKNNAVYDLYQIACAMLNAFYPPLCKDKENDKWLAEQMLIRSEMQNLLKNLLEDENLLRHTLQWEQVTEDCLVDFPKLTMSELRELTFGIYQLKQARSYLADTLNEDGEYDIFYHSFLEQNAVKFRVQSRHQNSKQRDLWIGYNSLNEGTKSVIGWYCKCPNGARIVGCCAHIASIIWYLSYGRYCQRIIPPAGDLDRFVRNATTFSYQNEFIDLPEEEEEAILIERGGNLEEEEDSSDGEWLS